jgi:hypothetical protein
MGSDRGTDPTDVRSLAVRVEDVVSALEACHEGRPAVLRAMPPYHARMRARLHVEGDGDPPSVTLHPEDLLADGAPDRPTPDETGARLRASDEEYSPAAHRTAHAQAVERWRERIDDHLLDRARAETPAGTHEVAVVVLGR